MEFDFSIRPPRQAAFSADGKPIGMFPKNQAKTMCVDVEQVYSPPVHDANTGSMESVGDESQGEEEDDQESSISSSASESSSIAGRDHSRDDHTADNDDKHPRAPTTHVDLIKTSPNVDSKSSSATITPVNKNFPRPPLDPASSTDTVTPADTSSRSNRGLKATSGVNNRSIEGTPTPKSGKKQSSFSFISQLSDELSSRTRPTLAAANRKISSMLRDDSKEGEPRVQRHDCNLKPLIFG